MDKELKHDLQHKPKAVTFTLDKERNFILDLNAYSELDLLYDNKTYHDIERDLLKMRPYAIRAFMWGGMVHEDRELTPDFIGQYIDVTNIQEYAQQIYQAILNDKPQQAKDEQSDSDGNGKKK
ncbi:hypothetical protein [Lentibacillus salicampi]|uniref:Uncharacterized protein n=1 Tax=Lentibacillus salicampi TaxID=175306 RepID=A0A4Y9A8H4_9BACI|nr:hypothetical protein [Lentibacillus salicampi]TFJ92136.1 hypothetical protein E4U82_13730 [Lentibacillus salicampi]